MEIDQMEVFCVIDGDSNLFSIKIQSRESVSTLRQEIYQERKNTFAEIDAADLKLYHVEIPNLGKMAEDDIKQTVTQMLSEPPPKLNEKRKLIDVFEGGLTDDTLIIVRPPPTATPLAQLPRHDAAEEDNLKKLLRSSPSSLAKPSSFQSAAEGIVYCNRPFAYDTIPIDLFQPEFGNFKNDCRMTPTKWAQELLQKLAEAACMWHPADTNRRSAIYEVLKEAGFYLATETISGTDYHTDGNLPVNIMPPALRECKNEYGCALMEAIAYYARFLLNAIRSNPNHRSRFPTILIVDVGPCIAFYGCLWTGKHIHVEPLTPTYDLTTHWTDEIARNTIASSLDAFRKGVDRITEHYNALRSSPPSPPVDRTFPYPTSYKDKEGQEITFTYQSRIEEKLIFHASADGDVENSLCVKFTKRYSKEAHQFLANLRYAPRLRGVTSLAGDWTMVVMDFSPYVRLSGLPMLSTDSSRFVRSKVRDIVGMLHGHGFVHGDIRDVNILVDPETLTSKEGCSVHLIDFDWAGKDQEVRYPGRVNTVTVQRPDGVSDGELITKSHDMEMVSRLLSGSTPILFHDNMDMET